VARTQSAARRLVTAEVGGSRGSTTIGDPGYQQSPGWVRPHSHARSRDSDREVFGLRGCCIAAEPLEGGQELCLEPREAGVDVPAQTV